MSVQVTNITWNRHASGSWSLFRRLFSYLSRRLHRLTYLRNFPQLSEGLMHGNGLELGSPRSTDAAHKQPWTCCFPWNIKESQCSPQVLLQHNGICRRDLASVWVGLAWVGLCLDWLRLHLDAPHRGKGCFPQGHQHITTEAWFPLWRFQQLCRYSGWR